eukprot:COSAG02_NODE_309_length_25051_cov_5.385460_15_plen_422_part_00
MAFQAFVGTLTTSGTAGGALGGGYPGAVAWGGLVGGLTGGALHMAAYESAGDAVLSTGTGMAGTAVCATVASPVRRMVTILQTQHANPQLVKKFTPHASSKFSFTWMRALSKVLSQQGVASLWRGNLCYLVGIVPETVGTLVLRDRILDKVRADLGPRRKDAPWAGYLSYGVDMVATCAAAATVSIFAYPLSLCYTRLAADIGGNHPDFPRQFTGLFRGERPVLATIFCEERFVANKHELPIFGRRGQQNTPQQVLRAVRGLYRGLPAHIAHVVPYTTSMMFFNSFFQPFVELVDMSAASIDAPAGAGEFTRAQLSVMGATFFAYPLKIMSIRLQMQSAQADGPLYSTVWRCAWHTWKNEGIAGFYRGVFFQLPLMPAAAVGLWAFNELKPFAEDLGTEEAVVASALGSGMLSAAAFRVNA